jgi:hypothetical protein
MSSCGRHRRREASALGRATCGNLLDSNADRRDCWCITAAPTRLCARGLLTTPGRSAVPKLRPGLDRVLRTADTVGAWMGGKRARLGRRRGDALLSDVISQPPRGETDAGVRHHVALSVVGTDRLSESGYFRARLAQERLIEDSSIPSRSSTRRSFFEFMNGIADAGTDGNTIRLPPALIQPMAAADVAKRRRPGRRWPAAERHRGGRGTRPVPPRRAQWSTEGAATTLAR